MRYASMHVLFGWTAAIIGCLSSETILACIAIAVWVHLGPISLLVLLPANFRYV